MDRRDHALAEQHRLRALETTLRIGDVMQQTIEILGLAFTAAGLGRDEDALRLEGAVAAKWKELGISAMTWGQAIEFALASEAAPLSRTLQ